jgi:hypothetical protein
MWSYYASFHRGICIEYDFSDYLEQLENSKMLLFPVNYTDKRVTIDQNILDKVDLRNIEEKGRKDLLKLFFDGLYTKNEVWKYEDEIRSITLLNEKQDMDSRKIYVKNISAIYLGSKMTKSTKSSLLKLISADACFNNLNIFEMKNDISEYKAVSSRLK